MKFTIAVVTALLLPTDTIWGFAPMAPLQTVRTTSLSMADMPLPPVSNDAPVIVQSRNGQPTDIRYSEFLQLVNANRVEKVTFSADGTQLLGVDVDGTRVKIQALPNDPDLLTQLTSHKVDVTDRKSVV